MPPGPQCLLTSALALTSDRTRDRARIAQHHINLSYLYHHSERKRQRHMYSANCWGQRRSTLLVDKEAGHRTNAIGRARDLCRGTSACLNGVAARIRAARDNARCLALYRRKNSAIVPLNSCLLVLWRSRSLLHYGTSVGACCQATSRSADGLWHMSHMVGCVRMGLVSRVSGATESEPCRCPACVVGGSVWLAFGAGGMGSHLRPAFWAHPAGASHAPTSGRAGSHTGLRPTGAMPWSPPQAPISGRDESFRSSALLPYSGGLIATP